MMGRKGVSELLWLLVLGAIWGTSYLFIKVIVAEVPPLTLVAGRVLLGAAVLWAILALSRQAVPRDREAWLAFAAMGFLNGALPYTLISWGEQYIDSGLAALLQATMPLFTVLIAWLVGQERLTRLKPLGVALGFGGVLLVMLPDLRRGQHAILWGQLAIVGSSVSYAVAGVVGRRYLRPYAPLVSTTGQLTLASALTVPLSLIVEKPFGATPSWLAVGAWVALSLLGTVVAYLIYYALLRRTSATFVSTVTYIIPVFGLLLGTLLLREPLGAFLFGGLALILTGVVLVRGNGRVS